MNLSLLYFALKMLRQNWGVNAECVYQAFTEKSKILNGYIVPEYVVLHTQSREYIVDDLLDVMKERDVALDFFYHSEVYQLIRDGVSDMHYMSDAYLADELKQEYSQI